MKYYLGGWGVLVTHIIIFVYSMSPSNIFFPAGVDPFSSAHKPYWTFPITLLIITVLYFLFGYFLIKNKYISGFIFIFLGIITYFWMLGPAWISSGLPIP
jgi:hypothetical protein